MDSWSETSIFSEGMSKKKEKTGTRNLLVDPKEAEKLREQANTAKNDGSLLYPFCV